MVLFPVLDIFGNYTANEEQTLRNVVLKRKKKMEEVAATSCMKADINFPGQ